MARRWWFQRIFAGSDPGRRQRTFVVQLRDGERLRIRAGHLWHHEASIDLIVWDEEFRDNRAVASFPLANVAMIYPDQAADRHSCSKFVELGGDDL